MTLRLALFDFDGTLADSTGAIVEMFVSSFAQVGLDSPPIEKIRATIGLPLAQSVAVLFPDLGKEQVAGAVEAYLAEYEARHRPGKPIIAPLFEGAAKSIAEMEKSMVLGIATGKSRRGLNQSLASLGIERRFVVTKTADDGPAKPNPAIALEAMAETGVDPSNTVVIGDTVYDMEMAKSAGAAAIGVSWGMHPEHELRRAGADRLITSFQELPALALQLTST